MLAAVRIPVARRASAFSPPAPAWWPPRRHGSTSTRRTKKSGSGGARGRGRVDLAGFTALRQSCSGWVRKQRIQIVPAASTDLPTGTAVAAGSATNSTDSTRVSACHPHLDQFNISRDELPNATSCYDTAFPAPFSGSQALLPTAVGERLPAVALRNLDACVTHFLPRGFAEGSVPANYFDYTKWSFMAAIASSAAMVLSTQAMLYAVGLGAGAIPTAAALNWVLKDGLGQLGGVLFASVVNNRFDSDPKRWRVIAAISLDGAVVLQSITPLFPALFLPLAALANTGMNVSWLAASASRAGIHLSFAQASNLADITAKAGSQTTFASTLGMAFGVGISPFVGSSPEAIIPCLACISLVHLGCVLRSLRAVALNTLNPQRADIIAAAFIRSKTMIHHEHDDGCVEVDTPVPSIDEVASNEVFIGPLGKHLVRGYVSRLPGSLSIGDPIPDVATSSDTVVRAYHHLSATDSPDGRYAVFPHRSGGADVALLLEQHATPQQVLVGHLHATYLRMALGGVLDSYHRQQLQQQQHTLSDDAALDAVTLAEKFIEMHSSAYVPALAAAKWNTHDLFLEQAGGRVEVV